MEDHLNTQPPRRFLPPKEAVRIVGLSDREIRRRPDFPKAIKLGTGPNGRIVYIEDEVLAWQAAQIAKRDALLQADPEPDAPQPEQMTALPAKRRGRPPGSRNKPKPTAAPA